MFRQKSSLFRPFHTIPFPDNFRPCMCGGLLFLETVALILLPQHKLWRRRNITLWRVHEDVRLTRTKTPRLKKNCNTRQHGHTATHLRAGRQTWSSRPGSNHQMNGINLGCCSSDDVVGGLGWNCFLVRVFVVLQLWLLFKKEKVRGELS